MPQAAPDQAAKGELVVGAAGAALAMTEDGLEPRDIGTQDSLKRSSERPAGQTRVKEADEKDAHRSDD